MSVAGGGGVLVRGGAVHVGEDGRLGPQLLLQLLDHPLQVLPGLPLQQQVGPELLAVGLGVLQLHLEVLDLEQGDALGSIDAQWLCSLLRSLLCYSSFTAHRDMSWLSVGLNLAFDLALGL